ncbi:acyltransferase [Curtobacterium sp. MCBD17_008]|uniref:acyltransferase family protein n=1 Tax=Curtobacterium sp. MCBD17_008 TaxID=2175656 RepID=UPI000DA79B75|nr:acyltransferase [Curtobacterium sp. MCBD17_008]PZE90457.1 acyltransferase [Curtobacterium sp. MCBD17_008]
MQHRSLTYKYESVQALRLAAALLVVVTHSTLYAHDRLDQRFSIWGFGTIGVDVFFVISGFVMMVSSNKHLTEDGYWRKFALRRLVRIGPMYWIATTVKLLTLLVLPGAVLHAALQPEQVALSYFFLPSRNVDGNLEPLLGVGWTLVFEMGFYLIFTLALALKMNVMAFCAACLSLLALGSLFVDHATGPAISFYLDPIVLYFLVGMVVAKWTIDRSWLGTAGWFGYILLLWVVIDSFNDRGAFDLDQLTRNVGVTAVFFTTILAEPILNRRIPRAVVFMGDASYSLYLFHPLLAPAVPVVLKKLDLINQPLSVALSVVGVLVAAALIYKFLERPITRKLQSLLLGKRPEAAASRESERDPIVPTREP